MHAAHHLTDQLLAHLELEATVFHRGQYCGAFRASTSGLGRATFHLVLRGRCWFHRPLADPVALSAGDAVFLLRDLPHALSPEPALSFAEGAPVRFGELDSTAPRDAGGVGLVCGFFDFKPGLSALLVEALPDVLLIHGDDPETAAIRTTVALIDAEDARPGAASSLLIERLAGVLFLYVLRHLAARTGRSLGLLDAARPPELTAVISAMVADPARAWTPAEMARAAGMSRATFFKRFRALARCAPASFLLALRVQLASRLLREGASIDAVAERVGYQSTAAFARAFKRATGTQPGAYRRASRHSTS